jgi:hypothetical protein
MTNKIEIFPHIHGNWFWVVHMNGALIGSGLASSRIEAFKFACMTYDQEV